MLEIVADNCALHVEWLLIAITQSRISQHGSESGNFQDVKRNSLIPENIVKNLSIISFFYYYSLLSQNENFSLRSKTNEKLFKTSQFVLIFALAQFNVRHDPKERRRDFEQGEHVKWGEDLENVQFHILVASPEVFLFMRKGERRK